MSTHDRITEDIRKTIADAAAENVTSSDYRLRWLSIVGERSVPEIFKINHEDICAEIYDLFLLVIVKSSTGNIQRRNIWRENWGAMTRVRGKAMRVLYLTAMTENTTTQQALEAEDRRFGDILQVGIFKDTYGNVTYKTLSCLKWIERFCPQAEYVLYVDDDIMIVPSRLVALLEQNGDLDLFGGYTFLPNLRRKDTKSKWFVKKMNYPHPYYPAYVAGLGTVFSRSVIPRLLAACASVPFMFHVDDAYLGICALMAEIKPRSLPGFELYKLQPRLEYDYRQYKDVVAIHELSAVERVHLYRQIMIDESKNQNSQSWTHNI